VEPAQLAELVEAVRVVELAMGSAHKSPTPSEIRNAGVVRKSIVAARAIEPGEPFTAENIAAKRPGTGISPMRWDEVLGASASRRFEADEMIEL
jgi:sialic acid synthase SpsE